MNKTLLALALTAFIGVAHSQTAPNPFARPTQGAAPGQLNVHGGAVNSGLPQLPNGGVPSSVIQPLPANGAMPGVLPGQPAMVQPGMPGAPAAMTGPEVVEEEVSVVRVGKVNGQYLYRGTGTYLFEPTSKKKVVRKPSVQQGSAAAALPAIPVPGASAQPAANFPSMVGRPAPTK